MHPGTICPLLFFQMLKPSLQILFERCQRKAGEVKPAPARDIVCIIRITLPFPGRESAKGMSRQVGAASIKWQLAPTAAKGWPAAVEILQTQKPFESLLNHGPIFPRQIRQPRKASDVFGFGASIF